MQATSILKRLWHAALRQRSPLWCAVLVPWVVLTSPVGVALGAAWIGWDARRLYLRVREHWTGWLDGSLPWLEDSSALLVQAEGALARMQRERILQRLQADLVDDVIVSIVRERVRFDWRIAGGSMAAALALFVWNHVSSTPVTAGAVLARLAADPVTVVVRVTPPRYTGVAPFETTARDLQVPQSSVVAWCLRGARTGTAKVTLGDGRVLALGRECVRLTASGPLLWRWRGGSFQLTVRRDAPPEVVIAAPKELLQVLAHDARSAAVTVRVRDDYRVRRASLHMTLARADGDELLFVERELAVPGATDAKARTWSHRWSVDELGMGPGDELYVFARATDNAAVPQTVTSPVYTLRLPASGEEPQLRTAERIARYQRMQAMRGDAMEADLDGAAGHRRVQGSRTDVMPGPVRTLIKALSGAAPLPPGWQRTALDWLADSAPATQRAVQEVADGCQPCRGALRARLRAAAGQARSAVRVQAAVPTPFARAWQVREAP